LPAPARIEGDIAWQSPAEPAAPPEQQDPLDWPQPYNEPPAITAREVEIRTLRALRTMRSRYAVRGDHHGSRDSVLSVIMQQLGRLEYEVHRCDRIGTGRHFLGAEPAGSFRLDRRDRLVGETRPILARNSQSQVAEPAILLCHDRCSAGATALTQLGPPQIPGGNQGADEDCQWQGVRGTAWHCQVWRACNRKMSKSILLRQFVTLRQSSRRGTVSPL
jgi:hypothetical protein